MTPSPKDARREVIRAWSVPTMLFLVAFALYAVSISATYWTTDVFGANWTSWHLVSTGSPWIDNTPIPQLGHRSAHLMAIAETQNGHTAFGRFPGVVVASLPAYLIAGSDSMSVVPGGLTAAFSTAGAVVLMFGALRQRLGTAQAVLAAALFGFTTPVWTVSGTLLWPHTLTVLGIAGMAWAGATNRWWWAGVFGGVALWGRLHVAMIVAVVGLGVALRRRDGRPLIAMGLTSGLFLVANCVWVRWMYGTWNPLGTYGTSAVADTAAQYRFDFVNYLGMWVAPDRGLFVWTPTVLILLPALVRSWRDLPDWSRSLVWGGLVYTLVECALNTFTGGYGFYGYRYGLELLACLTPALALAAPRMGRIARRLIGPVFAVQLLAFMLGAINDTLLLPQKDVWKDNAFVHAIDEAGAAGWVVVAVFALLGVGFSRLWPRIVRAEAPASVVTTREVTTSGSR